MRSVYSSKKSDMFTFLAVMLLFFFACFGALYMPSLAASGVRSGITYSLEVLLPSLFPFMFLSAFSSEYGISSRLGRIISPLTESLLYLPGCAGITVLLGMIGGYPVGAVGTASLLRRGKITADQAKRMLFFCVNPGPAFLISAVGDEMYGSKRIGAVLFAAQTAASLLLGCLLAVKARFHEKIERNKFDADDKRPFSEAFVLATKSACSAAVSLCSMVVLFSAFSSLILGAFSVAEDSVTGAALRSVLEVTDGCARFAQIGAPMYLTALAVGWGGLCVHFQVFAAIPELSVNKPKFVTARLIVGAISACITMFVEKYTDVFEETLADTFSNIEQTAAKFTSSTFFGSLALFVSCVLFLIFITPRHEEERIGI